MFYLWPEFSIKMIIKCFINISVISIIFRYMNNMPSSFKSCSIVFQEITVIACCCYNKTSYRFHTIYTIRKTEFITLSWNKSFNTVYKSSFHVYFIKTHTTILVCLNYKIFILWFKVTSSNYITIANIIIKVI